MKAFLLAAGLGTRLLPMTESIPKCLVKVCERPILDWWINLMERHGITDVLINVHHLPEMVINYISKKKTSIRFKIIYEDKLLGSAGTLRENKDFIKNQTNFFVFYADNLTNYNLTSFLDFHKSNMNPFSMALFRTGDPTAKGIALLNENKTIVAFEEKPQNPKSNLANAGLYICTPEVLDLIPNYEITDIGYHLLPKLKGKMNGWETDAYLIDIGTKTDLSKAEKEWSEIINKGRK